MIKKTKGVVLLKDWFRWIDDKQYQGVFGFITVHQDKENVGFSVRGNNTNWFVKVKGKNSEINILGCQVRMFITVDKIPNSASYKIIP